MILRKLAGIDRRSIGRSNEVVSAVLAEPALFKEVFSGMVSGDPVISMRAADAKVCLNLDDLARSQFSTRSHKDTKKGILKALKFFVISVLFV